MISETSTLLFFESLSLLWFCKDPLIALWWGPHDKAPTTAMGVWDTVEVGPPSPVKPSKDYNSDRHPNITSWKTTKKLRGNISIKILVTFQTFVWRPNFGLFVCFPVSYLRAEVGAPSANYKEKKSLLHSRGYLSAHPNPELQPIRSGTKIQAWLFVTSITQIPHL